MIKKLGGTPPKTLQRGEVEPTLNKYTVKAGDTLGKIAAKHNLQLKELISANPQIKNPNKIVAGQEIQIPKQPQVEQATSTPATTDLAGAPATFDASVLQSSAINSGALQATSILVKGDLAAKALAKTFFRTLTLNGIEAQAKAAGLSPAEAASLRSTLNGMTGTDFNREVALINDALASGNPDRALRTYMELAPLRAQHPSRLTPDIVRSLVMGVGTSRTSASQGREGVLGQDSAIRAAKTLIDMPQSQYNLIASALNQAGQGGSPQASAETERALILKAVAARDERLSNPNFLDYALMALGLPMGGVSSILTFANQIRGMSRASLIENTSVLDLDNDGTDEALQQRFSASCGPTTAQITKAESDPIYALRLHDEPIHSTSTTGDIADEQERVLEANDGVAVARGTAGGVGMTLSPALNEIAGAATDRTYTAQSVTNSSAGRTQAMNDMEYYLRRGIDVPIRVEWSNGGGHFLLASDVRGQSPNREFLITDPWTGRTGWVSEADIADGSTDFFAGTGRLTHIYPGTQS